MKSIIAALLGALGCSSPATAQTVPSWIVYGAVGTPAQWQAAFAGKQDYSGTPTCGTGGCTFTGEVVTAPSTASNAGLNIPPGTAPTSPVNGDIWSTANGFYYRVNGTTVGPISVGTINTVQVSLTGVNFNSAATDNAISIPSLPSGYSRYEVDKVVISNASHTLTTATFGLFTATSGSGTVIASTAITVSGTTDGAANNAQVTAGPTTVSYTQAGFATLYFRTILAEGSAATANVSLRLICIP
jgi:hypothetical protein